MVGYILYNEKISHLKKLYLKVAYYNGRAICLYIKCGLKEVNRINKRLSNNCYGKGSLII